MNIVQHGSVRIDLLGGTLDLKPINLILKDVITLNLATSLKARVEFIKTDKPTIKFKSLDYKTEAEFHREDFNEKNLCSDFFGAFTFFARILSLFNVNTNLEIILASGSPPGAGLGGSSAMGITFYKALCSLTEKKLEEERAVALVNDVEARLLDCGPAGYQDYYPALYGGVLALKAFPGSVQVEQLFTDDLKVFIENHVTLVYTRETRFSGFNNWEVYKAFFDRKNGVREGMTRIAQLSEQAYQAIRKNNYSDFLFLIGQEGAEREKLFPNIVVPKVRELYALLKKEDSNIGMKVCGAGGGGCFILTHKSSQAQMIENQIEKAGMEKLSFSVERPLHG